MWSKVLNIATPTIWLDNSSFRLGGDSITVIQLVALAHESNLSLSVSVIFSHPTLEQMARDVIQDLGPSRSTGAFRSVKTSVFTSGKYSSSSCTPVSNTIGLD